MMSYRRTVLENGIRILTEEIPHVRSASIGFWYAVGSQDETSDTHGLCHLIEHLCFKGTTSRTARQIAETIDATGGQLNAFTSKENTCYYARVLDQHLGLACDVLADMLRNSLFDEDELSKEKGVVIEEIKMYEDSPDELVHDLCTSVVFGDHPIGKPILGTSESVGGIRRQQLVDSVERAYIGTNLVVAVAGNITHDQVVSLVSRHFSDLPQGLLIPRQPSPPMPTRPDALVKQKDVEQVHLCLATPGFSRNHADRHALSVLDAVLGGGMSSRLFQELREERGLVYSTFSYHSAFADVGLFAIYAGTGQKTAEQVVSLIKEQCEALRDKGISHLELERAKEQLKGGLMLSLEGTTSRMSRLAKGEMFYDRILSPEELIARVDAVTVEDVQRVAHALFRPEGLFLAAVGPVPDSVLEQCPGWRQAEPPKIGQPVKRKSRRNVAAAR